MRLVRLFAIIYVVSMVAFVLGLYVSHARVWPFPIVRDIYRFVQGHRDEATSVFEKISNDAGIRPERFLYDHAFDPTSGDFRAIEGIDWASRRDAPYIRVSDSLPDGYVYIVGKFDFEDGMNGVLLFDTKGNLVKRWVIPDREIKDGHHHLFAFRPDGSFISAADYADIYHLDACGNEIGRISGNFHHSIARLDDTRYWVNGSVESPDALTLIDISTHSIDRTILLDEVHKAVSEEVSIFNLGRTDDPWHNNDAEPLPAEYADRFAFNAGDLLISYRHLNLVYVLDPETLETKWWTNDYSSGQHDPDWEPDGTITIYDNRALGKQGRYSTVQRYDFGGGEPSLALDGRDYGFYSGIGGKHELYEDGSILALAYEQGRVVWVWPDKSVRFEFVNRYTEGESLVVLNTGYLPADYFDVEISAPCN